MGMFFDLYESSFNISDSRLFLFSVLVVMALSLAAALLSAVLRRVFPIRTPGTMVATMLTGILLPTGMVVAFVASDVWHNEEKGRAAVETEAAALSDVQRAARYLDPASREKVNKLVDKYVHLVADSEWPEMGKGTSLPAVDEVIEELAVLAAGVGLQSDASKREAIAAKELGNYVSRVEHARDSRLRIAEIRVRLPKWLAVFIMLFVSACVIAELHLAHPRTLIVSLLLFSLAFGVTVFLIAAYDRPFTGKTIIEPTPLYKVLQ